MNWISIFLYLALVFEHPKPTFEMRSLNDFSIANVEVFYIYSTNRIFISRYLLIWNKCHHTTKVSTFKLLGTTGHKSRFSDAEAGLEWSEIPDKYSPPCLFPIFGEWIMEVGGKEGDVDSIDRWYYIDITVAEIEGLVNLESSDIDTVFIRSDMK